MHGPDVRAHSPDDSTFLPKMTSHGRHHKSVTSNQKPASVYLCIIYLKNNPARFHPDPIWNNGAMGFFEECRPKHEEKEQHEEE